MRPSLALAVLAIRLRAVLLLAGLAAVVVPPSPAQAQTRAAAPAAQAVDPAADAADEVKRQERLERAWRDRSRRAIGSVCSDCRSDGQGSRRARQAGAGAGAVAAAGTAPALDLTAPPAAVVDDLRAPQEDRLVLPEDRMPILKWLGAR